MNTCLVRQVKFTKQLELTGTVMEDWLNTIIEKSKEGYEIVTGTVVAYSLHKTVRMEKPEDRAEPVVEEEVIEFTKEELKEEAERLEPTVEKKADKIDREYIKSINGDKDLLEVYGIEHFGINLQRNKSFKNMLRDLEKFLEG